MRKEQGPSDPAPGEAKTLFESAMPKVYAAKDVYELGDIILSVNRGESVKAQAYSEGEIVRAIRDYADAATITLSSVVKEGWEDACKAKEDLHEAALQKLEEFGWPLERDTS